MSEKMKVSKEVAEAIESIKFGGKGSELESRFAMLIHQLNSGGIITPINLCCLNDISYKTLSIAYWEDCEVEKTPEENLAQQYNYALNEWGGERRSPLNISEKGVYKDGYIEGIRDALAILEIKIQGVNRL